MERERLSETMRRFIEAGWIADNGVDYDSIRRRDGRTAIESALDEARQNPPDPDTDRADWINMRNLETLLGALKTGADRSPKGVRKRARRLFQKVGNTGRKEPRLHFALSDGSRSGPPVRVYSSEGLDMQLEAAARAFLQRETRLDVEAAVLTVPRLMRRRFRDFAVSRVDAVRFIIPRLENGSDQRFLRERLFEVRLRYKPHNWRLNARAS